MNQNYRTKPEMEDVIVDLTVAKGFKTRKPVSKQSVFEEIFWEGVASVTKKYKK